MEGWRDGSRGQGFSANLVRRPCEHGSSCLSAGMPESPEHEHDPESDHRGPELGHLPRLDDRAYCGYAFIHWSMTVEMRKRGWLSADFHSAFRFLLLHSLGRYGAACPVYCLMPDHLHLLLVGWHDDCNQRNLVRHLRKHLRGELARRGDFRFQKQPYENVLRSRDRVRGAFERVAFYIGENRFVRAWLKIRGTGSSPAA